MTGRTRAGDVHRPDQAGRELPLHLLGGQLLEVAGVEVRGVIDEHVDAAKPFDGSPDSRIGLLLARNVKPDGKQVVGVADRAGDHLGVAAGGHDVVAGGQRGLGEVDAHAAPGTRDEPCPRISHAFMDAPARRR
jgi:hypothetical protein